MQIITTRDGSHTLFSEQFNEVYHSRYGAIEESKHICIKSGLDHVLSSSSQDVRIFELGFGTGLNALLTMLEAEKRNIKIDYTAIELHPVPIETIKGLNYTEILGYKFCYGPYHTTHLVRWNETHQITPYFSFKKINESVFNYLPITNYYSLIYFDAFAPTHQPEIWTAEVFKKMYDALLPGGILVTYCSKVVVQKAMKEAGFTIEKIPGPPGRREMLRVHRK
ncbi:MAG: tRNA (5-methylaminomethyl-2-thiouridine)(34)-methyltransferase MnmD [Bacteroidota bacterium]